MSTEYVPVLYQIKASLFIKLLTDTINFKPEINNWNEQAVRV